MSLRTIAAIRELRRGSSAQSAGAGHRIRPALYAFVADVLRARGGAVTLAAVPAIV
jgi:hypothetical protein